VSEYVYVLKFSILLLVRSTILTSDASVGAYAILIASNEDEAARIHAKLAPGRGHVCTDTAQLAATFERIFQASLSGNGA